MKFPLARRLQGADASAKDSLPAKAESVALPSPPADVKPNPVPPTDNLVAQGFDEQGAPEYGRIEAFDGRYLSGWYFDKANKTRGLTITFDDKALCGTLANLSRMDVVGANPQAPERCGFFVDLARFAILDRCADLGELYARMKVVSASGAQLAHVYGDPFASAGVTIDTMQPLSSLDGVERGVVNGWAVGPKPGAALLIHVIVDGLLQGAARTNLYREDIGGMTGNFNAGFAFFLSPHFQDGRRHTVSCLFADTGEHLANSPKDVLIASKFGDEGDRAAVLAESFFKLQREIESFRDQVKVTAAAGVSYFVNYPFFQDVVHASGATLARLRKRDIGPAPALFSIVMPTYKTDPDILRMAIDSVVAQTDRHWELVISDSSSSPALRHYMQARADEDPRIRVILNEGRLGISDNTNVALRAAKGEYVGFMDHDDELAPEAISLNRAAFATGLYDIVYSDEDKIDSNGNFVEPHYKSAFDLDLLLCMNYMCHLVFARRSSILETELNRRAYDGAQDWDLLLQLMRRVDPRRVGHIPRVLYHWRMIPGSTATAIGEKSYAVNAGLEAVKDYLVAVGADADAAPLPGDLPYVDVRWHTKPGSMVSVIIPTKDRIDLVTNCVNSVLMTAGDIDFEILIVDNNSTAASCASFESMGADPRIRVLRYDGVFNYSAINNFAAREARGDFLLLLNNDVFFTRKGWLAHILGVAQRPDVGAVGLKLLYPDNTVQHCGVVLGVGGVAGHAFVRLPQTNHGYFARLSCTHEVSAVTAACLLVRSETFFAVGGLEERDLTIAFNDGDFCIKIGQSGLRNIIVATTFAYHAESLSRGYEDTLEKIARFEGETATMKARWALQLAADRFYSPNFDLNHAPYTVLDLPKIAEQEVKATQGALVR